MAAAAAPSTLIPYYQGIQLLTTASPTFVICETAASGNVNNLPTGTYLVSFLQKDTDLTNPAHTAYMGTAVLMVNASGTNTYTFVYGFSVGNVVTSGTPSNQDYLLVGSSTVTIGNSMATNSTVEWSIAKMI